MKEILFRGKLCDKQKKAYGKEWAYGYFYITNKKPFVKAEDKFAVNYEVIPGTVGQYIGLTDKCGTKIVEGDIVKIGSKIGVVEYSKKNAMFMVQYKLCGDNFTNIKSDEWEVVGNIHDNPELLEG